MARKRPYGTGYIRKVGIVGGSGGGNPGSSKACSGAGTATQVSKREASEFWRNGWPPLKSGRRPMSNARSGTSQLVH